MRDSTVKSRKGVVYKVWMLYSCEPYESPEVVNVYSNKGKAEHARDWCEAIELNREFEMSAKYGRYSTPNKTEYYIEEQEVIA